MLLDEDRLRDYGTQAAGTQEPGERCDEMNEKNDQIAYFIMVSKPRIPWVLSRISNSPGTGSSPSAISRDWIVDLGVGAPVRDSQLGGSPPAAHEFQMPWFPCDPSWRTHFALLILRSVQLCRSMIRNKEKGLLGDNL